MHASAIAIRMTLYSGRPTIPPVHYYHDDIDVSARFCSRGGGVIWHDLRRTFATELRARQVHEYDIADLLGHNIQTMTALTLVALQRLWKKP